MSSFKIKSNLDIGGNQLLNYCVGTYDDLTSVNRNPGYKFFYVPSSIENKWYKRELIFDGDDWRAAAYLDDIDRITNGEGSLGTRVKALEDMLGLQDVTDVIDTWNDVKEFFTNVDEGLNLMTMLDGKLDNAGGTIKGDSWLPLQIVSGHDSAAAITVSPSSRNGLQLGWSSAQGAFLLNYQNNCQIGVHPDSYPYFKTYTDSYVILHSGNVGDFALKIDGSNTMTGNLKMTEGKAILWGSANLLQYTTSKFIIGRSASIDERTTEIHGYPIIFRYGNDEGTAMTITDGGRVVIGTDASVDGDKLYSRGRVNILSLCDNPTLGNMPENGLVMTDNRSTLGIAQWVSNGTGAGNIQVGRFDGTATAYTLNLNPLGGAVNVGGNTVLAKIVSFTTGETYYNRAGANYLWAPKEGGHFVIGVGANIGDAYASLSIYDYAVRPGSRNNAVSLGTSSYRWSNVYSTLGDFSGRVLIGGAEDDGESALQVNKTMSIGASKTDFGLRFNRNTIYAWIPENHAYGHNAQFGLKVGDALLGVFGHHREANGDYYAFIGTSHSSPWFAINSTESFFNVATTFNRGALIPTGQKLTIGDATIEYDSNAKAIKVDGNMYTTGTLASGGKADAQQGGTGGNAEVHEYELRAGQSTYTELNPKGSTNVIVQVYEWNANDNTWDMILTDVSVTANIITVTFGRPTSVDHMVTVV